MHLFPLTGTHSNGPHKLLGDCGNIFFFHVKEEARVGSKHTFFLPQIICLYWQSSRYLYNSNNSHLLCYPVASDYLTSFPFSMESNKSFVIVDVALSWNLTSGYPCGGPFNLGIDFWLNMKWPCCEDISKNTLPISNSAWLLSEGTGFILALQLASVDRVQRHMGLSHRQRDPCCWGLSKTSPRADDMFIWACLCSSRGSLFQNKVPRDSMSISN